MRAVLGTRTLKNRDTYGAGQAQDTGGVLQTKAKEMQGTKKYLSMSDPAFSGGDPLWGYGTYLNHMQEDERRAEAERKSAQARMEIQNTAKMYQRRAEAELKSAQARMEIQNAAKTQQRRADAELKSAQARMDIQNAAKMQQPDWEKAFIETMNRVSPTLPRPDAAQTANPYIDKGLVSAAMPNTAAYPNNTMVSGSAQAATVQDTYSPDLLAVSELAKDIRQQMKKSGLPSAQRWQIETFVSNVEKHAQTNPHAAYGILRNVQARGVENFGKQTFSPPPPLADIRNNLDVLNREMAQLQKDVEDMAANQRQGVKYSQVDYQEISGRQWELIAQTNKKTAQLKYRKELDMYEAEKKYPFYSGSDDNSKWQPVARIIAEQYKSIWYNIDETQTWDLLQKLYPTLYLASAVNTNVSMAYAQRKREQQGENTPEKELLDEYKNKKINGFGEGGFITRQSDLGSVGYSDGDSAANGCGWISVYNVLNMLKANPDPYEVMRSMENGALALGAGGTDPLFIANYLNDLGYDAKVYFTKEGIEREAPKSDANIWVYGWYNDGKIGAHYVACAKQENGSAMVFYNAGIYNDNEQPYVYRGSLMDHYLPNDLFRLMICVNKP